MSELKTIKCQKCGEIVEIKNAIIKPIRKSWGLDVTCKKCINKNKK